MKRTCYVPKKVSGSELKAHIIACFNDEDLYNRIMRYFKENPKKTVAKIKMTRGHATIRKYPGGFYTFLV